MLICTGIIPTSMLYPHRHSLEISVTGDSMSRFCCLIYVIWMWKSIPDYCHRLDSSIPEERRVGRSSKRCLRLSSRQRRTSLSRISPRSSSPNFPLLRKRRRHAKELPPIRHQMPLSLSRRWTPAVRTSFDRYGGMSGVCDGSCGNFRCLRIDSLDGVFSRPNAHNDRARLPP